MSTSIPGVRTDGSIPGVRTDGSIPGVRTDGSEMRSRLLFQVLERMVQK
jgi:hypothetical protein